MAVEYSVDNGTSWFWAEPPTFNANLGTNTNLLAENHQKRIRDRLASGGAAWFRFVVEVDPLVSAGAQLSQDVTWSATG